MPPAPSRRSPSSGGVYDDLRRWHAREVGALDAPGYSIGGLSVGESKDHMWAMTEVVNDALPVDRPRYLMGVGSPEDLVNGVARGVDMFDCVLPTRLGRNGLFTDEGRISIRNSRYREQSGPVDASCDCATCLRFSAAYLHHLFRNDELLGYRLASIHNIRYLVRLTERMREAIAAGRFDAFQRDFLDRYQAADETVREEQRAKWTARARTPRRKPRMSVLASLKTRGSAIDTGILPLRPFLATVFSIDAMTMLVVIAYGSSYLLKVLDSPPSYPAYALGIYGFMKLLSAPIGGRLLDRFPARVVVTLALALSLTGLALIIAWHAAAGYLVGVAFLSYGIGTSWLVMFHVLGLATVPSLRARITSYMALVSGAATATGFATGGLIALTDYWWAAFAAGAVLATAAGTLLRVVVNRVVAANPERRPPAPEDPPADPPQPNPPRRQVLAGGTGLVHSAALGGVAGIFGPFVLHTLDLQLISASLLLLPAIAAGGVTMWFAGRHSRPGRRLRELALFYGIGAVGLIVLAFVNTWYGFMVVALALDSPRRRVALMAPPCSTSHTPANEKRASSAGSSSPRHRRVAGRPRRPRDLPPGGPRSRRRPIPVRGVLRRPAPRHLPRRAPLADAPCYVRPGAVY
jgi:MFS family permease